MSARKAAPAKKTSTVRVSSERPVSENTLIARKARDARKAARSWPKTIGACVDLAYQLQQDRQALGRKVAEIEQRESDLKDHMRSTFKKNMLHGAQGAMARVELEPAHVPNVENWDVLNKYIAKNNQFDLLQRRLSITAIRERWDANKSIPGVSKLQIIKLALHKLPSRKQKK